jgi:Tfp pilus assembly protein PilN
MIKVNLVGMNKKKAVKPATTRVSAPTSVTPLFHLLIVGAFVGYGYWWYSSLSTQSANLSVEIQTLDDRRAALEAVIKQDVIYEARKKMLESRVKIIESLQKNHVSPILALDQLSDAVERTRYVWLSSLEQKEAVLSMNGTGTSLSAIADFYTNLNATGHFRNVDLGTSQESAGNYYTFSLKCEFAPPRNPTTSVAPMPIPTPSVGGN